MGLFIFLDMKQKFLPWFLLFCAIGLSATAAYYSVIGLSIVFVGVAMPVIVMGSFLEVSKIAIATYLHNAWKNTYTLLKIYLTLALVVLSVITSIGIYGLLSTGFQENIAKLEIGGKQIQNIEVKKQRFEEIKSELEKEKTTLDKDISQLRNALSTNTTTQSVDRTTGQVVTRANNANRKSFETQLSTAQASKDKISSKIDALNDSITNLDIKVLDMESKASESNELGAVQYVSEITGADIKTVANWFIFMLIFVFDPLAITLVIATNQAFDRIKPKMNIYGEPKPIEPEVEEKLEPTISPPISDIQLEKEYILNEISKIQKSGVSGKKAGIAIHQLQNRLNSLNDDNTKTY
jgi:exonuclease VII small subunit